MDLGGAVAAAEVVVHHKTAAGEPFQELLLSGDVHHGGVGHRIDEGGQLAPAGDAGVFLAKRPCRRVARVGKDRQSCQIALAVEAHELALGHVDLTTHFQKRLALRSRSVT